MFVLTKVGERHVGYPSGSRDTGRGKKINAERQRKKSSQSKENVDSSPPAVAQIGFL
jgi:hypothetical protein